MELTDTSPEAGQTTASDPLCPPRGSPQSPPHVHLPPKSGTEPVSRRPRALSAPAQGPVLLEGMGIIEGGELQTVCPRLQIHRRPKLPPEPQTQLPSQKAHAWVWGSTPGSCVLL